MTLLLPARSTFTRSFGWTFNDGKAWVANNRGAFAGSVDPQGGHFYTRDKFGRYLGDYPTLAGAKDRLEKHAINA